MSIDKINPSWHPVLKDEFQKTYFRKLSDFVEKEYKTETIYPPKEQIFSAFNLCPYDKLKLIILGQDPYHGANQAHGLSFSVQNGVKIPPSLRNIYKELRSDLGIELPKSGNLEHWAKQGILMINATFTVRAAQAGSHQKQGWENFTDAVISKLSAENKHLVFFLWGNFARKKNKLIDSSKHLILESAHPSPLSAYNGFFGNKHFSLANNYLQKNGKETIIW